ncbi:uncharacterized protein LOC133667597 [Apis cerana]|uniref:uncharacterized protein LOC133667597 n=1 Tax=Apis cerana TaxID=7461 RepID=UPI002B2252C1|nr:uncharacterized protein LOC133667597 [Apis cerana]
MPTIKQLIRNTRQPVRNVTKSPALRGCPQRRGTCTRVVKRGYIARKRRTKIRLFASSFRGSHSRLTRTITQQKIRALVSAHRDRDKQREIFVVCGSLG